MMRSVSLLRGRNLIEREEADKEKGRAQARPLVNEDGLFAPADPAQHPSKENQTTEYDAVVGKRNIVFTGNKFQQSFYC